MEHTNTINTFANHLKQLEPEIKLNFNHPLAPFTSLNIGGPGAVVSEPKTKTQLINSWLLAHQYQLPVIVLGHGSNVLVSDRGWSGVVIINKITKIRITPIPNTSTVKLTASSGTPLGFLVRRSVEAGFRDLIEFASVPGTLGGAVWNNAHFQGKFIGDYITKVTAVSNKGGQINYPADKLGFGYDTSRFQNNQELILSVTFKLKHPIEPKRGLQLVKKSLNYRLKTQPIGTYSTGCIFQNLTKDQQKRLNLPTDSAGWLIDKTGLKGLSVGQVRVSQKHANFFVHQGRAKASDFYRLIQKVKQAVKNKWGIELKEEVRLIGFND